MILNLKIALAQLFTKIPKVDREIEGNLKKYKGWNVKTTDRNPNSLLYVIAIAYITEMHNKQALTFSEDPCSGLLTHTHTDTERKRKGEVN